ncbi:RNA polymerase sigma-70 factor, ECF subfamily [Ekhidna lutea]|uniref:RNA polymerase sigma-70 factor, ECF subfamily n=1 Tax=Ekhidna lutea TaxID=447679 RepID=A0A239JJG4_EKHLU|nr:sigma-70 family RNA polymerase sigma factor [Ekhidna lutea]SNT06156.1 RNA polymerase sigma-70 factor, ECF subfamily [Ekhidna lutea]
MQTSQLVDHFFRTEYGKAVSHLTSKFGASNLELAEDSVQEALIKAMQTWPYAQIPDNPTGWILRVARNKMIDQLRRDQKTTQQEVPETTEEMNEDLSLESINDDMVRMMFACCHPSLSQEYQIILTLKILGGLSVREISSSLLKKEETVAKAYTRAKKKFKQEEIKLLLPPANEIEKRLEMVLKIIYLLFNEGYKSAEGEMLIRKELCEDAIRLNRVLLESEICNTPTANSLMALMHFHAARFSARTDENGDIITLENQDRSKWDQNLINQGLFYLEQASDDGGINEYIIQAAISAVHCQAPSFEETNWMEILRLYDLQLQITPSPIVRLNRIVPLEKVHGPHVAYTEIEELEETSFFDEYYLFYAIKSDLLNTLGESSEARVSLKRAIDLTKNEREKAYLKDKLKSI